jgi:2-oxoglutarate ferredoxin oxidoreductase subunit beta
VFDEGTRCVAVGDNGRLVVAKVDEVDEGSIVVHDVHGRPSLAFALAHLSRGPTEPTAIGVFREVERPVFGEATIAQVDAATERLGKGSLDKLLHSGDTWNVG